MAGPPHPPTGLLSLPLEVRLQIYDYLLRLPSSSSPSSSKPAPSRTNLHYYSRHQPSGPDDRVHPALLRASRQLHAEATPTLYARNTFLAHPSLLAAFPRLRPWYPAVAAPRPLRHVRRFRLHLRLDADLPFDPTLPAEVFGGAHELAIVLVQATFCECGPDNLRCFEPVRGVKSVSVDGSTTGFEDYARWLEGAMRAAPGENVPEFEPEGPGCAGPVPTAV